MPARLVTPSASGSIDALSASRVAQTLNRDIVPRSNACRYVARLVGARRALARCSGSYSSAVLLVLITGLSGTGKSTLVAELRRRGYRAYDADEGFSEPRADGEWGWNVTAVANLLSEHGDGPLFFAGCSEEQTLFRFDLTILLTVPLPIMAQRLRTRTGNDYGKDPGELARALAYVDTVEPVLRASADTIIETSRSTPIVADEVLRACRESKEAPRTRVISRGRTASGRGSP